MLICPRCGKEYDIEYYEKSKFCECGTFLSKKRSLKASFRGFFKEDPEKAIEIGTILYNAFRYKTGFFDNYTMPEYVMPNAAEGSRELALYYTYIIAIDKQTDANKLWMNAIYTYNTNPDFFQPENILNMDQSELENLIKSIGARYFRKQANALKIISKILYDRYDSDPREITPFPMRINEVMRRISSFPELRGVKLSRLYLRVMAEKGLLKISNLKELDVAVDQQVCRFTFYTGILSGSAPFTGTISGFPVRSSVESIWKKAAKEINCGPYQLDQPIWSISSRLCKTRFCRVCPVNGHCNKCFNVEVKDGKVKIKEFNNRTSISRMRV